MHNNFDHSAVISEAFPCQTWQLIIPIEGTGQTSDVSAVEYKGKLYLFYTQEKGPDLFKLGYTVMVKNPENKLVVESINELPVQDAGHFRPAVTVYENHLFCFYTATDQTLRFSTFAGDDWSPLSTVPHTLSADAPSVVAHEDKLYVALQGTTGGMFYHIVLDTHGWYPNVPAPHINFSGSPSLCIYNNKVHVALRGLDGRSYVFFFMKNQWHPVFTSQQTEVYGPPALHAWGNVMVIASLKHRNNRYTTELRHPLTSLPEYYDTAGTYLSPPCLTRYLSNLYLIGKRPCNDLAISVFNPNCARQA